MTRMANFRDGQEGESGTIRRDQARVRGGRDDQGIGGEAWGASENGAPGDCQCDPSREEETRTGAAEAGSGEGGDRPDAGERSARTAQTAAYGTPNLDSPLPGASQPSGR